jgi:2-polyprenyl-3-methyl-5-hydroxy-6-metoxy-1,4-benzoquinol methylase
MNTSKVNSTSMFMYCEICNKKLEIYKKLEKFDLLRCYSCDHTISKIRANKKYYQETYSSAYAGDKHKNWMTNPNYKFYEIINGFIKSKRSGKIIDVGCGIGMLLKYLSKKDPKYDLTGVDIIAKKGKKKSKINFIKKDIFKYSSKKKFSFVLSIAVIEHVPKIKLYLNLLKKISNKDSSFIINTVNTNSFLYKIASFLYYLNIKTPFVRLYDPHHLNHFSNKSLEKVFKKNGFSLVKRVDTPVSMKHIDIPPSNIFMKSLFYVGVYVLLKSDKFINNTFFWQTVIFKRTS